MVAGETHPQGFTDLLHGRALVEKLIGLQGFSSADRAGSAVVVTVAIKQTAMTAGPVAAAPAPQLGEQPGVLLSDDISLARRADEHQRIEPRPSFHLTLARFCKVGRAYFAAFARMTHKPTRPEGVVPCPGQRDRQVE